MPAIDIRTPLPGPNSQAVLARRAAAVSSASYYSTPVVAASARGATVTDVDGNTFLDFTAGIGTVNVGHTPVEVVEALQQQASDLIHLCAIVGTYESYIALAEKLNALAPVGGPAKSFLANSGAEAVETAIKLARGLHRSPRHRHLRGRLSRPDAAHHDEAFQRGLLLIRAGLYANGVRTLVPLTISDAELEEGIGVLEASIAAIA